MARVAVQRMSKAFGAMKAVDGLDLAVADGEFLTLLGPSGCGKSTALACIAGLERPSAGSIVFDGADVTELAPHSRNVAMVFQDYALYPHMSVKENISFGLKQQRLPVATVERQVAAAAEMLGLDVLMERRPAELSGGQRQRVAVGRAIVRNPAVLLMDEPLSNLDASLRVRTRTEIKRLQREIGTTTIFVTHDQEEAMVLSDRIAVMRRGELLQIGPPMEVYRKPADLFVARFIGSPAMNLLEAELGGANGTRTCRVAGHVVELPASGAVDHRGKVLLGIRPSDLMLQADAEPGALGPVLQGEVFLVEPVGPVCYLDVDIAGQPVKGICDPDVAPAPGERVTLGFSAARAHLFDPASERRL